MSILIRRSNLMVPVTNPRFIEGAWSHNADAVTLDLEDGVADTLKEEARHDVKDAIRLVIKGAAEVFVRVNKPFVHADIEAAAWPGLTGVVLPRVESAAEVADASEFLGAMERSRGIEPGFLQLLLLIESAQGLWHVREIIRASPRVTQVGLDESGLGHHSLARLRSLRLRSRPPGHRSHSRPSSARWNHPPHGNTASSGARRGDAEDRDRCQESGIQRRNLSPPQLG